jgi:hypothetical protein
MCIRTLVNGLYFQESAIMEPDSAIPLYLLVSWRVEIQFELWHTNC